MSYKGAINLQLAEQPTTTNVDVWNDMIEVYRAIHLLNAGLGDYINGRGSGGPERDPWDAMPFERWFYSQAAEDIPVGAIVTVVNVNAGHSIGGSKKYYKGVVKGAPIYAGWSFSGRGQTGQFKAQSIGTGLIGVALEECKEGELCKVGVGPAIIKVEGVLPGDTIMAPQFADLDNYNGIPVMNDDGVRGYLSRTFLPHGALVVGYGVATDSVFITPWLDYRAQFEARRLWDTPFSGGPSSEA